ncbi:MAG: amino acid transporter [archaeon]|nr:amino acid transporter [archaeon]
MAGNTGSAGSSFFFIANLLNFVLATAIFTLPFPMYETGFGLGTIILAITCFVSVTACSFIIESLGRKNSLIRNERKILLLALGEDGNKTQNINGTESSTDQQNNLPVDNQKESLIDNEEEDEFYIERRFEISKLAKILPKPLYFFVTLTIICYLYVGVTSNGIIAGNNLKDIIGKTIGTSLDDYWYYIIVSIFFVCTISLALNNIKNLKKFSMFIMIMRFVVISLIIGCCIYTMCAYEVTPLKTVKAFDFSNITVMIGNSLFVFMSHHSIPGMVENFSPQKNLIKLLVIGYFCSFLFLVLYGYLSILAFGRKGLSCDYEEEFPAAIQSTFSSNLIKVPVIGYIINYYPGKNIFNIFSFKCHYK